MFPDFAPAHCPNCGLELGTRMEEGRERLFCGSCDRIIYLNPKPYSGVIAVKNGEVLMVKRGVEPGKGKWSIPAGFIEWNERPEKAAVRELKEETGLEVSKAELELHGTAFLQHPDERYLLGTIFKASLGDRDTEIEAGSDAVKAKFLDRQEVKDIQVSYGETEEMVLEVLED